jgi:phosphotriesterase-related protein
MATVETVNRRVDLKELGLTLIHEHFRTTDEATRFRFPHLYDQAAEWEAAMSDANAIKGHGVQTVVSRAPCSSSATPPSASAWPTRAAST